LCVFKNLNPSPGPSPYTERGEIRGLQAPLHFGEGFGVRLDILNLLTNCPYL
jgi:hypothetical protein